MIFVFHDIAPLTGVICWQQTLIHHRRAGERCAAPAVGGSLRSKAIDELTTGFTCVTPVCTDNLIRICSAEGII